MYSGLTLCIAARHLPAAEFTSPGSWRQSRDQTSCSGRSRERRRDLARSGNPRWREWGWVQAPAHAAASSSRRRALHMAAGVRRRPHRLRNLTTGRRSPAGERKRATRRTALREPTQVAAGKVQEGARAEREDAVLLDRAQGEAGQAAVVVQPPPRGGDAVASRVAATDAAEGQGARVHLAVGIDADRVAAVMT